MSDNDETFLDSLQFKSEWNVYSEGEVTEVTEMRSEVGL